MAELLTTSWPRYRPARPLPMEIPMRLPWRKARVPEEAFEEAVAAKAAAGEHLAEARGRGAEVRRVASGLKEKRERNGFSEGLRAMLRAEEHGHAPHA